MERYSEYKDSGIYYIPLIPSSWNVLKGKILFKEEKRPIRQQDEIVTCFRDGQVTLRKNRRLEGFTNSLKEIGYQGIRKGDLVIHNMDAFAGAIGVSDSDGKGTPVYAVCTPIREDVNQYYYCFLLRFLAKIGFIQSLAKGIRERSTDFRYGDFKELLLPVPSRAEQDAIVRYLDAATLKIDKAIAMQQKMIDLLNERKQIIIQNAVTKGLDENVEMKDSGVEWTEFFPNSWSIKKVKYIFEFISTKEVASNRTFNIALENIVAHSGNYIDTNSEYEAAGVSFRKNDILFGKLRPYLAKVHLCERAGIALGDIFVLRPLSGFNSSFLRYLLISERFIQYVDSSTYGAKMPRANWNFIGNIYVAYPTLDKQRDISKYLDKEMQRFDSAISNCQRQIALLQERKQIIINEVVTGKVKVS